MPLKFSFHAKSEWLLFLVVPVYPSPSVKIIRHMVVKLGSKDLYYHQVSINTTVDTQFIKHKITKLVRLSKCQMFGSLETNKSLISDNLKKLFYITLGDTSTKVPCFSLIYICWNLFRGNNYTFPIEDPKLEREKN